MATVAVVSAATAKNFRAKSTRLIPSHAPRLASEQRFATGSAYHGNASWYRACSSNEMPSTSVSSSSNNGSDMTCALGEITVPIARVAQCARGSRVTSPSTE